MALSYPTRMVNLQAYSLMKHRFKPTYFWFTFVSDKEISLSFDKYRMKLSGYNPDVDYVKSDSC